MPVSEIAKPVVFDAEKYKKTTRTQWDSAAEAWDRWNPLLNRWLGPATVEMLDLAGVQNGSKVLDVAAGAGEQSITAAKRVGPAGKVHITDISPGILKQAEKRCNEAGLSNCTFQELDGEAVGEVLNPNEYDCVMSRVGLIYFPDRVKALKGMHQVLKPGGKVAAITYATGPKNPFFSEPVRIIRERADFTPPAGAPGPFSLGDPEVLRKEFEAAGFKNVQIKSVLAPVCVESAKECVRFEKESFGALHTMMAAGKNSLTDAQKEQVWLECEEALKKYEHHNKFEGPCEMLVATGTK